MRKAMLSNHVNPRRLTATRRTFLKVGACRLCQECPEGSARRCHDTRSPPEIVLVPKLCLGTPCPKLCFANRQEGVASIDQVDSAPNELSRGGGARSRASTRCVPKQGLGTRGNGSNPDVHRKLKNLIHLPRKVAGVLSRAGTRLTSNLAHLPHKAAGVVCRWLPTIAFLAIVGTAGFARAQDDEEVEDIPPAQPQQQFMVADENFDQWVFGGRGTSAVIRKRIDSQLILHVEEIERTCGISESQKKKLQLAGRGDIKRLFDRVEELRKKFQLVKNDQNKFNQFWQDVQPFQLVFNQGSFGPGSFFSKTLKTTLTSEQVISYQAADRDRRMFQYRSTVEAVIGMLDQIVSFRAEQRQKLVDLLVERKRLPRVFGQYNYYLVIYQMSQLPEAKLKEFVDEPQLKALNKVFNQARGYEPFLKSNGYLPEEEP